MRTPPPGNQVTEASAAPCSRRQQLAYRACRRSTRAAAVASGVALLAAACGPFGGGLVEDAVPEPSSEMDESSVPEAPDTWDDDAATGGDTTSDEGESDAEADDGANRLELAMVAYEEIYQDDPDAFGGRCTQLADWSNLRSTTVDLPEAEVFDDGGFERIMDELHSFGCAVGAVRTEGFGYPAVITTVRRGSTDQIAELDPASTPDGLDVNIGTAEVGDLPFYTGEPVSVAVLTLDDFELHVTAPPEVLAPEDLLPLLDAAWRDLAAFT